MVLGSTVAEDLFDEADPLGQKVKIKGKRFTVIGVLEEKGGGFMGFSMDDIAVVPITTFQTKLFSQQTANHTMSPGKASRTSLIKKMQLYSSLNII